MTGGLEYAFVCHECATVFSEEVDLAVHNTETVHRATGTLKIEGTMNLGDRKYLFMTLP